MAPYRLNTEGDVFTFLCGDIGFSYTVISACFKDYDFGITEFLSSVNTVAVIFIVIIVIIMKIIAALPIQII